ncbi:MAG: tetratricopeptide repeat protein, partial [Pseudomonadota bacterium]
DKSHLTLPRLQADDLDLITLKLLAKEPEARYGSCVELIQDLERWCAGRPVEARAPTWRYRLRKWLSRNQLLAASFAAAGVVLTGFVMALVAERNVTRLERDRAVQAESAAEAVNRFLVGELLASSTPAASQGRDVTVREVLDRAAAAAERAFPDQPLVEASVRTTLSRSYLRLGRLDAAAEHHGSALALIDTHYAPDHPARHAIDLLGAEIHMENGRYEDAAAQLDALIAGQQAVGGPDHLETLRSQILRANVHHLQADWNGAERLLSDVIGALETSHPTATDDLMRAYYALISVQREQRRTPEAVAASERLLGMQRDALGERHPDHVSSLSLHAQLLDMHEKGAEALEVAEHAYELAREVFEPGHRVRWHATNTLATLHTRARRYDRAEFLFRDALKEHTAVHPNSHPVVIHARSNLAVVLNYLKQYDEAIALTRASVEHYESALGPRHPTTTRQYKNLIRLLGRARLFEERRIVTARMADIARSYINDEVADAVVMSDMASFLLTCLPAELQDPDAALLLAQRAVALGNDQKVGPRLTLASALARQGPTGIVRAIELNEATARRRDALHLHALVRDQAALYLAADRVDDGETFFEAHIARRVDARAPDDPLIGIARLEYARFLIQAGRSERAVDEAQRA